MLFTKGFCPSCKIHPGDFVLVVKFIQGLLSTLPFFDPGASVPRGFCPYPGKLILLEYSLRISYTSV